MQRPPAHVRGLKQTGIKIRYLNQNQFLQIMISRDEHENALYTREHTFILINDII